MQYFFKNKILFSVIFFSVLLIDILVKLNLPSFPYRYISKPPVVILLFLFFIVNKRIDNKKKYKWVILGLLCFFAGDIFIINHIDIVFLSISLVLFSLGKLFLSLKFSHRADFEVIKLIPFSIVIFVYTVFIVSLLYSYLESFFVPALLSFFLTLLLFQFAFLRKSVVNKASFSLVFIGVILFIISESLMAIKTFKSAIPFQDILIMVFYGTSLYLIVLGILKEDYQIEDINPSSHTSNPTN